MPSIRIVKSQDDIPAIAGWVKTDLSKEMKFVNENRKEVGIDYKGKKYQLIEKREREFGYWKRFGRIILGTILTSVTLGAALYFSTSVQKLFTKKAKVVYFGIPLSSTDQTPKNYNLNLVAAKEELEADILISNEILLKIQNCFQHIINSNEEDGLKFYTSQYGHRVFELDTAPGLIFKMVLKPGGGSDNPSIENRYEQMVYAQNILRTNELGLLIIPHAKIFEVEISGVAYKVIAEEKLDINPITSMQGHYFEQYADNLDDTIRQLAIFICESGYSDVEYRNNPIINNITDNGRRKIALIDIEETSKEAEIGLFGSAYPFRTGLVSLVNERQGQIVKEVAEQYNIANQSFYSAYNRRLSELEENRKLEEYYKEMNIVDGTEEITVDIEYLGLEGLKEEGKIITYDLDESGNPIVDADGELATKEVTVTMEEVLSDVIQEMNKLIKSADARESLKGRRSLHLKMDEEHLNLGLTQEERINASMDHPKRWLQRVMKAMVDNGVIFSFRAEEDGYHIQA